MFKMVLSKESTLSKPENVSLRLNTDGVAIFRSSNVSIWPVWIIVNELPRFVRYSVKVQILTYNSTFDSSFSRAAFRGGGGGGGCPPANICPPPPLAYIHLLA